VEAVPDDQSLRAGDVKFLYERLLGRVPTDAEVGHQVDARVSWRQLLDVIVGSEEFGIHNREGRPAPPVGHHRVNIHHADLVRWEHAPGTWSTDGVAVVGHEGWLFIGGGSNANLAQFTGEAVLPDSWADGWRELIEARAADGEALGVRLVHVVVPDKLAIHEEHFPAALERHGPRPVERLTEAGLPLVYPLAELRAERAAADVCLRTDSHLTIRGNAVIHRVVLEALGAQHAAVEDPVARLEELATGDLGSRFDPAIVEVFRVTGDLGGAELTEDNYPQVAATGGHVGIRRVLRNDTAPDPRTVVVFGDSYGFPDVANHGVAWFLSQSFRCVHFVWVPCGWDPAYVRDAGAELVVSQTAERFVARIPLVRVDTAELAERGRRERAAISPDVIFDDAPADAG
jgi:alginate O-acetyltransferase complex protein AlgJ